MEREVSSSGKPTLSTWLTPMTAPTMRPRTVPPATIERRKFFSEGVRAASAASGTPASAMVAVDAAAVSCTVGELADSPREL